MYTYEAEILRVVDGDTLDLRVDLGFEVCIKVRVRLACVDTPETFGVKKMSPEWIAGMDAVAHVHEWISKHAIHDGPRRLVYIQSKDGSNYARGKYGRWLVEVFSHDSSSSLNKSLLENGHAEEISY